MNIVMDDASEVYLKEAKPSREIGTYYYNFTIYMWLIFNIKNTLQAAFY